MTMRRGGLVGRAVLTLAAAVVPVALAPLASASPEGDADAAITAAWEAGGGAESRLGPKQGQVYAVGDGFVQDFAGGKMFFTPRPGPDRCTGRFWTNTNHWADRPAAIWGSRP